MTMTVSDLSTQCVVCMYVCVCVCGGGGGGGVEHYPDKIS